MFIKLVTIYYPVFVRDWFKELNWRLCDERWSENFILNIGLLNLHLNKYFCILWPKKHNWFDQVYDLQYYFHLKTILCVLCAPGLLITKTSLFIVTTRGLCKHHLLNSPFSFIGSDTVCPMCVYCCHAIVVCFASQAGAKADDIFVHLLLTTHMGDSLMIILSTWSFSSEIAQLNVLIILHLRYLAP